MRVLSDWQTGNPPCEGLWLVEEGLHSPLLMWWDGARWWYADRSMPDKTWSTAHPRSHSDVVAYWLELTNAPYGDEVMKHKLVPVEPDYDVFDAAEPLTRTPSLDLKAIYCAMIAAAPTLQVEPITDAEAGKFYKDARSLGDFARAIEREVWRRMGVSDEL